ncbi:MAG TPA: TonB-dependent receptor [Bryobacteraceae bacterium]|nr:TonB-dependent receptor [Bryobacteraceae bacterium]
MSIGLRFVASAFLFLYGAALGAQFVRGTILGTVSDESGAVIPGAEVVLKNAGTNETKTATTDEGGAYTFPALLPAVYSVQVTRTGFKARLVTDVKLEVNQTARVDVKLPVGEVAERVEVLASAMLLKTDTSEIGHVVSNKQIVDLPLNGRDYLSLARLIPGVVPSRAGATLGQKGVSRSVNSVGARDTSVSYLLDGVDTNDVSFQTPSVTPSIDAIQEFKVLQNAYSAEFGRGATQILAAIKGGSNEWHGSLFEFNRNDKLASRSFFQPSKPAALKQNQFGATFGGPVLKDRTFFFLNYEGQRIRTAGTGFGFVPTPQEVQGDFSAAGEPRVFDPNTFDAATRTRQQFPGNRIPANRFSARALKVTPLFQQPNYSGRPGQNYARDVPQINDNNQGNARVDHRFSAGDSFFARYSILDSFRTRNGLIPLSGTLDTIRGQNIALNWVHTFSPSVVNEMRLGFNRNKYLTPPEGSIGENPARDLFGITNTTTSPIGSFGLPAFSFSGGYSGLGPGSQFPQNAITQTWQLVDSVTWLRHAHSLKAGVDLRRTRLTQFVANNDRGSFNFTGQFTNLPSASAGTGSSIADLLLGLPLTAAAATGDQLGHNYNELYGFYFQDDWKISRRLTLNLGVRYEYIAPWREKLDRYTMLDFNDAGGRLLLANSSKAFTPGQGIVDTGKQISRSIIEPDLNNWAPRIGLAFRPMERFVIRSGYGVFYDIQEGNEAQFLRNNAPFIIVQNYSSDPLTPTIRFDTLFPAGASLPSGAIQPFTLSTFRTPYVQQWNFNIEHELMPNLLWEVGYVGSKGTHLLRRTNFQQGDNILVKDPANPTPLAQRVRYPNFSPTLIIGSENGSSSTYHGLITKLERRYANGISFLVSYSYSKSIDDGSGSSNFTGTPSNAQCRCDLRGAKGPSAFDITHRGVASYSYDLPLGRGHRFMSGGAADKLFGGWQVNGITSLQTGPPFQIQTQGDNANIGSGAGSSNHQRPNVVGDPYAGVDTGANIRNRGVNAGTFYFNRGAYVLPPLFRLGNLGKNTLRGPGAQSTNLSVLKNTRITERFNTQLRAEFFNVFNQTSFEIPGNSVATPTYGIINGVTSSGRVIQFALKLLF